MGGDEPARTLIAAALTAGKPVVTANKHVIAHHGPELEAIARRGDVALRFEAAVGGGIPILGPLAADLAANELGRVRGIVNGTTNYILSAMAGEGREYAAVLADAQGRGYAEADPTGDVEGDDAVNKLVILARLAFGSWIEPSAVVRRPPTVLGRGAPGITGVTREELAAAAVLGLTIKLLATARRAGDEVLAGVLPSAVAAGSPFGATAGVLNRIEIDAEPLGSVSLSGPGAGGAATSSAVLGDLVAVARGLSSTWAGSSPATAWTTTAVDPSVEARDWFAFVPGPRSRRAFELAARVRNASRAGGWWTRDPDRRRLARGCTRRGPCLPPGRGRRDPLSRGRLMAGLPSGPAAVRPRLVDRYRRFLPITDATPALTLGEGATPLVHAARLGAALGLSNLHLKIEGQNPTGSFKDRGHGGRGVEGGRSRRTAIVCASTGNTSASAAAYGAAAGMEVIVVLPKGQIAVGQAAPGADRRGSRSSPSTATSTTRSRSSGRLPSRTTIPSPWSTRSIRSVSRARRRPPSRSATTWARRRTSWPSRSATPATSAPTGRGSATTRRPG